MDYTPHEVAKALRGEEVAADLAIEISIKIRHLPRQEQQLLTEYGAGWSAKEACDKLGIGGNPQRVYERALKKLTGLVNGEGAAG